MRFVLEGVEDCRSIFAVLAADIRDGDSRTLVLSGAPAEIDRAVIDIKKRFALFFFVQ